MKVEGFPIMGGRSPTRKENPMRRRPDPHPEHADYRARVIEADRAATRMVEGLRRREPWALRMAAWMEERTGERCPECHCDECTPLP
jgi:hypothetical protein